MIKKLITIILLSMFAQIYFMPIIKTATAGEDIDELKKQIDILQTKVSELEAHKQQQNNKSFKNKDPRSLLNQTGIKTWNPFEEMGAIQEEMNRMFQDSFAKRNLSGQKMFNNNMNLDNNFKLKETKNGYKITLNTNGIDKNHLNIEINENSIIFKGQYSKEDTKKDKNQYYSTQSFESFMQTIPLPSDADTTNSKMERKEDLIIIELPKKSS